MTVHMLIKVQRWLLQTKVWRFVGFASAAVGLVCYALSSSFNYLFGNWNLLKIILYTVFSFIICIMILYENIWKQSRSLRFKAHTAFLVLTITSVYSFYFDKVVNGKPDAYSLISCAAFAIMSLSLSRQSHCGFEVDLLYFFLGCLTVLLMKIKFQLFIIGAGFASSATRCFTEVFHGSTFQLLNFANAVADGSPSIWCLFKMLAIFETLHHLISKFHLGPDSSVKEAAVTVQNRLGEAIRDLFLKLNYLTFRVPAAKKVSRSDGRHHPTAVQIISYVTSACRSRHTLEQVLQEYPKVNNGVVVKDSFIEQMEWIMDMLEKRLTYKSKEYRELALRYLFMMNNRRHIEAMIKSLDLETIFGNDWFQRNQAKFQQDLDLYQRYSWNKVLEFLKLDNNDCAALNGDVAEDILKEKLKLFNKQFEEFSPIGLYMIRSLKKK
ncbi:putative exocyst complex component Exo70, cullin repeat-like-containing domain-containing protein [Medicago truncatula]|uniref:Exocyst subunit Exo70 family protein n=1 Tax=Medicago truncatula TaxID=3880 RepID=A0A396HZ35_MEDTR|nr:exocyst complex component EXO70B1 [Medicago truncatula]RHN57831.1 putative exocyst complex component Exo70, cullin repeat-like-containing domain-containing protein [Medicago truncatula]